MTPEELARKIQAGDATETEKVQLYEKVKRFCFKIAKQYSSLLRCPDEIDDLLQESYLAIMEASKSYDQASGVSFIFYLAFFLRRSYETYIGQQSGMSSAGVQRAYAIRKYEAEYDAKFGRNPSDENICAHFNMTPESLEILRQRGNEKSLNDAVDEDEELTRLDLLADPHDMEEEVLDKIITDEVRKSLRRFLDDLPQDQRRAVYIFYVRNRTDKQGAADMNVTVSAFRNLRTKGVKNLRRSRNLNELGRYLPERIGSAAYKGYDRNRWTSSTEYAAFEALHEELFHEAQGIKKDALRDIYHTKRRMKRC